MCGIAGILTTSSTTDISHVLNRMRESLVHRGPDGSGLWKHELPNGFRIGFAHTRLAILDLSDAGHQPMLDQATGSCITYNGEVYNHRELRQALPEFKYRSQSDTETILAAWRFQGDAAIQSFRGMFALALFDAPRRQLTLVRDRLGIKPLYMCRAQQDTWLFASELRAIQASELVDFTIDREGLAGYLTFGAVLAPQTLIKQVESLLPGETCAFDLSSVDGLQPRREIYWHPVSRGSEHPSSNPPTTRVEAVESLRSQLSAATRLRMLSDVPVGVFLSGGIDSSAVVASLVQQGFLPHTFSVSFTEAEFDESAFARAVAKEFGTHHEQLCLEPDQVLRDLDEAWAAYDQPSIDGVNSYFISRCVRQAGVKVALSGLGGDELFAGYPSFRQLRTIRHPLAMLASVPMKLAHQLGIFRSARYGKLARLFSVRNDALACNAVVREVLARSRRSELLGQEAAEPWNVIPPNVRNQLGRLVERLDPIAAHSCAELGLYLANMLLRDTDQMSMAHALEVRVPLLDHRLVESTIPLPADWKLANGRSGPQKGLLLDLLPVPLPKGVVDRKKMGFVFPWERWLRGDLKDRISGVLNERSLIRDIGLNPEVVARIWNDYLAGHPGVRYTDVLCLTHLLVWVQTNLG